MARPVLQEQSRALVGQRRLLVQELKIKTKAVDQLLELVDRIRTEWKISTERCKKAEDNWRVERLYRKRLEKENCKLRQQLFDSSMQSPQNRSRKRSLETSADGASDGLDDSNITKRRIIAEELSTVKEDTDEGESELEDMPSNIVISETPQPVDLNLQTSMNASFESFSTALASGEMSSHDLSAQFDSSRPKLRRSTSVPNILQDSDQDFSASRVTIARTGSLKDENSSDTNAVDLLSGNRSHELIAKRNFVTIDCAHCRRAIRFGSMSFKCKTCKLLFHESCKRLMNIACLPRRETPRKGATKGRARLGDFCADTRPLVPHIIGHCIIQLEKAIATSEVYLESGNEESINNLLNTFKAAKTFPELSDCSSEVLAGCVKKFLNEIRDPLIPLTYRKEFCEATSSGESEKILECIKNLPTCHAHTLIALCIHWRHMCECNENEETISDALATTVGPIIFGTKRLSGSTPSEIEDKLIHSFRKILELPTDHFRDLLNSAERLHGTPNSKKTPISRTPSNRSNATIKSDLGSRNTPLSRS